MELVVNGERERAPETVRTLADLMAVRKPNGAGACAVEIARKLIPRRDWPATALRDGDEIEIVTLVGGG